MVLSAQLGYIVPLQNWSLIKRQIISEIVFFKLHFARTQDNNNKLQSFKSFYRGSVGSTTIDQEAVTYSTYDDDITKETSPVVRDRDARWQHGLVPPASDAASASAVSRIARPPATIEIVR